MEIYDVLKKDHDVLRGLLEELNASKASTEDRKGIIEKIKNELVPHSRAEEAVFYNSLRLINGGGAMSAEAYAEHAEAETILHALNGMESLSMNGDALVKKLTESLHHHLAEEEDEVFPQARQLLIKEEAEMMSEAFADLKAEIAEQGDMKNMLEFIVNMMPERFRPNSHHL